MRIRNGLIVPTGEADAAAPDPRELMVKIALLSPFAVLPHDCLGAGRTPARCRGKMVGERAGPMPA
jgi:hypothetical protein